MLANTHIKAGPEAATRLELLREGFPDHPETGPALCRELLDQVAAGRRPATIRLSRPGRVVAFGRRDAVSPGYFAAVAAAARNGFPGMERLAGGRAAAFTEGALSLALTLPDPRPAERTGERFRYWSELVRAALAGLGIDARIGSVPGEYCPGDYSINADGRIKLAGAGQRMIRGAAHLGFIILVTGSELVADTLQPVYRELGLAFDRMTTGSLEDRLPGIGLADVEGALIGQLSRDHELLPRMLDPTTLEIARSGAARFRSNPPTGLV